MNNVFSNVLNNIGVKFNLVEDVVQDTAHTEMLSLVEEARKEWVAAKNYFDNVLDPDLIDHAVYVSQAAEKRYMYLLKQARSQNVVARSPVRME